MAGRWLTRTLWPPPPTAFTNATSACDSLCVRQKDNFTHTMTSAIATHTAACHFLHLAHSDTSEALGIKSSLNLSGTMETLKSRHCGRERHCIRFFLSCRTRECVTQVQFHCCSKHTNRHDPRLNDVDVIFRQPPAQREHCINNDGSTRVQHSAPGLALQTS